MTTLIQYSINILYYIPNNRTSVSSVCSTNNWPECPRNLNENMCLLKGIEL